MPPHRTVVVLAIVASVVASFVPAALASPGVPASAITGGFGRSELPSLPSTARFSFLRKDGNDVRGPLDLASLRATRGTKKDLLTWSTHGSVSNKQLDPKNGNFAVGIDTNDDRRSDFFQYGFYAAGRLRGVLVNIHTGRVVSRTIPTSRVNARTFRQNVVLSKIGNPKTYRFVLYGYYQGAPCSRKHACSDTIPNRYPLLPLDHAAPSLSAVTVAGHSTDVRVDLNSTASFTTKDDTHGTGIKSWKVERRTVGTTTWTTVKTGTLGSPTVLVPGAEGGNYQVRITSTDKQANAKVSALSEVLFPYDDVTGVGYSLGTTTPTTGAFLGGTTSVAQTGTATITFTDGSSICLLRGPAASGSPTATVTLDSVAQSDASESNGTPQRDRTTCYAVSGTGSHTLVLTVTSADAFVLDGYYVEP